MGKTCYNCGTENAESERFCRECGANLEAIERMGDIGLQGGTPEERVLWDNGEIQLTTEAVLIGMGSDMPDVVPLSTVEDVVIEEKCVVLKVKDGPDYYCMLADPHELADLIKEQVFRPRLAHQRKDIGYIAPE